MKTKTIYPVILLSLCLLAACARPYTAYVTTRQAYNEVLEEYLNWFDVQEPEVQTYCRGVIDPQFERATATLDAWGHGLLMGEAWGDRDAFLDVQEELMKDLLNLYSGKEVH